MGVDGFRGGLVFKAHRLWYHSTLGLRVIEKKRRLRREADLSEGALVRCLVDAMEERQWPRNLSGSSYTSILGDI